MLRYCCYCCYCRCWWWWWLLLLLVIPAIFFYFVVAENLQIGGVFEFSEQVTPYNTVNIDVFLPQKHKPTIYMIFFASGSKIPSKNIGICAVFDMLQEDAKVIFPCKSHNTHVNYSVLGLTLGFLTGCREGISLERLQTK